MTAREVALRYYAQLVHDLDRMSSDQLIVGDIETAMRAAGGAEIADRAYVAERDDPVPVGLHVTERRP